MISRTQLITSAVLFYSLSYICPCLAGTDLNNAIGLIKSGQYQKAIELLDKGVDDDPTNGELHYWRGKCLNGLGKKTDAISEFKLATLLTTDLKTKNLCRSELTKYKVEIPRGSVNAGISPSKSFPTRQVENQKSKPGNSDPDEDKYFKLSSKKLDWNLKMNQDFVRSMSERTQNLGKLASASSWRMPPRAIGGIPNLSVDGAISRGSPHRTTALTADERKLLSGSDIVILLDHSGSMQTMDCPSNSANLGSRFTWCVEELVSLTNELASSLPHGFTIIPFESKPEVHFVRSSNELLSVLKSLSAGGGTDLAAALKQAFKVHSNHITQPLLIAVVSDAEIDLHSSEQAIVQATRNFPLPNGVFITLLQIGHLAEIHTSDQVHYLDNIDRHGAAYDAFKGIPFSQVRSDGFGKDLLLGLRANTSAGAVTGKFSTPVSTPKAGGSVPPSAKASNNSSATAGGAPSSLQESSKRSANEANASSQSASQAQPQAGSQGTESGGPSRKNLDSNSNENDGGNKVQKSSSPPPQSSKSSTVLDTPPVMWTPDSAK